MADYLTQDKYRERQLGLSPDHLSKAPSKLTLLAHNGRFTSRVNAQGLHGAKIGLEAKTYTFFERHDKETCRSSIVVFPILTVHNDDTRLMLQDLTISEEKSKKAYTLERLDDDLGSPYELRPARVNKSKGAERAAPYDTVTFKWTQENDAPNDAPWTLSVIFTNSYQLPSHGPRNIAISRDLNCTTKTVVYNMKHKRGKFNDVVAEVAGPQRSKAARGKRKSKDEKWELAILREGVDEDLVSAS